MVDSHMIEGVQKNDVGLTAVVDQHFVQIPSCYRAVDYHGICVWSAAQVDIPGVEGERYMGTLRLHHWASESDLVHTLIVVLFLSLGVRMIGLVLDLLIMVGLLVVLLGVVSVRDDPLVVNWLSSGHSVLGGLSLRTIPYWMRAVFAMKQAI
jgi:hypothetical protein